MRVCQQCFPQLEASDGRGVCESESVSVCVCVCARARASVWLVDFGQSVTFGVSGTSSHVLQPSHDCNAVAGNPFRRRGGANDTTLPPGRWRRRTFTPHAFSSVSSSVQRYTPMVQKAVNSTWFIVRVDSLPPFAFSVFLRTCPNCIPSSTARVRNSTRHVVGTQDTLLPKQKRRRQRNETYAIHNLFCLFMRHRFAHRF